ncbi:uncharacterized protein [Gossypium hirsutum]|uniref:Reverse transcriptase n=1 Tax=Gossypium hirsutum TaxID=3635 RepID=A0A1U8LQJ8_GOSHI|nr:uncharacterized protein LOC107928728 [Gossypium hirsutum]
MNSRLLENFRAEEISKAVMEMGGTKAPGFDGFQAVFFQKFWGIVGEDVTKFCIGVLNREDSLNEHCISSVQYAVTINGRLSEYFQPGRGLRQRDLFSPYLFLICTEGFSSILKKVMQTDGCRRVMGFIEAYEKASGQKINMEKSQIFFSSNCSIESRYLLTNRMGVRTVSSMEKYLGFPTMVGRKKKEAFQNIIDRLRKRVNGWGSRMLSQGCKEVFIKIVLQAIPIYAMSCFLLPKSLCVDMEKVLNRFWWSKGGNHRGLYWSCWSELCKAKERGGLNFRDMGKFNIALLAKQGWRLVVNPDSLLARIYKAKYYPRSSF